MSAATDGDRALEVIAWGPDSRPAQVGGQWLANLADRIAAAFAEIRAAEREAALAPVLALAGELNAWRENALRHARSCPPTSTEAAKSYARAAAYQRATDRIRTTLTAPLSGQHTTDEEADRG